MVSVDPKELHERLVEANANQEFISGQIEEAVRDILRGIAAKGDGFGAVIRAAKSMELVMELMGRCKRPASWDYMLHCVVAALRNECVRDGLDSALYDAEKSGIGFIAEMTSGGDALNARIAKRRREFLSEIESVSRLRNSQARKR